MAAHRFVVAGQVLGMLTVLQQSGLNGQGRLLWLCRCDCGNEIKIPNGNLTSGKTRNCGCVVGRAADKATKRRQYKTAWMRAARSVDMSPPHRPNNGPLDMFLYAHPAPSHNVDALDFWNCYD